MKTIVLFVHGLGGDKSSWGKFPDLVTSNLSLPVQFLEYPTPFVGFKFSILIQHRYQTIEELAKCLKTCIDERLRDYDNIILVAHSMGGLIVRKYLLNVISSGQELKVSKVFLYAVPNFGATLANFAAKLSLYTNPHLSDLKNLSNFITNLNNEWLELKVELYVDVTVVVAGNDKIVTTHSAEGPFEHLNPKHIANKGHINIVKPKDKYSDEFLIFKNGIENREVHIGAGDLLLVRPEKINNKSLFNRLKYQSEDTEFTNRELEIDKLNELIETDLNFDYMIMEGHRNVGKSRLAFQYCKQLMMKGWNAGFVNWSYEDHFASFFPKYNHFIVIDGIIGHQEQIKKLIDIIISKDQNKVIRKKVRILFIERLVGNLIKDTANRCSTKTYFEELLENKNPLHVKDLSLECINNILGSHKVAKELSESNYNNLTNTVNSLNKSERLLGSIIYTYLVEHSSELFSEKDFNQIYSNIVKNETKNWENYGISDQEADVIIIASLVGGIELGDKVNNYTNEVQELITGLDNNNNIQQIIGENLSERIPSISHDSVSELLVLERIKTAKFGYYIELALGINPTGGDLISFFSRAASDYPKHEALKRLMTPFKTHGYELHIWMLIMANSIHLIPEEINVKLKLLANLFNTIDIRDLNSVAITLVNEMFVKLIYEETSNERLLNWMRVFSTIENLEDKSSPFVPFENGKTDRHYDSDYPDSLNYEYCVDLIKSFKSIADERKHYFYFSTLLDAYNSYFVIKLNKREISFEEIKNELSIIKKFMTKPDNRYGYLILHFQFLIKNILAGLYSFNAIKRGNYEFFEFTKLLLKFTKKNSLINSKNYGILTVSYYESLMIATVIGKNSNASYSELIEICEEVVDCGENEGWHENISKVFIGTCVQMGYGITTASELKYVKSLYERARKLLEIFCTQENIESMAGFIDNIIRCNSDIMSLDEEDYYIKEYISLGVNNIENYPKIIIKVLNYFSMQYNNSLVNGDDESAKNNKEKFIAIIKNQSTHNLKEKLYGCSIPMKEIVLCIESGDFGGIDVLLDLLCELIQFEWFQVEEQILSLVSLIFNKYKSDKNKGINEYLNEYTKVLEKLSECQLNERITDHIKVLLNNLD